MPTTFDTKKAKAREKGDKIFFCPYRPVASVECVKNSLCEKCGWFPETEERRKRMYRRKMGYPPNEETE